jgi:c(7)-type cytochrome triheme protein
VRGLAIAFVVALGAGLAASAIGMPDQVRIPIVSPTPGRVPAPAALFGHGTHGQFACYACHPTIFPRQRVGFTHAEMHAGRFCAACHDGVGADAIAQMRCEACHVP